MWYVAKVWFKIAWWINQIIIDSLGKTDAPEEYNRILHGTVDYYIEHTINSFNIKERVPDFDLANVLYQMYKHEYVCVSVTKNIWYRYKNNRWEEIDAGTSLRLAISK